MSKNKQVPVIYSGKKIKASKVELSHYISITEGEKEALPLDVAKVVEINKEYYSQLIKIETFDGTRRVKRKFTPDFKFRLFITYPEP